MTAPPLQYVLPILTSYKSFYFTLNYYIIIQGTKMTNPALPSSIRRRIIEKVSDNRLTIIVGPTGCGELLIFK